MVTLKAERSWPRQEHGEVLVAERPQGSFTRQLQVGEALDTQNVEASYNNGVLTLTIPVAQSAQPRRIEVRHDQGEQRILQQSAESESGDQGGAGGQGGQQQGT